MLYTYDFFDLKVFRNFFAGLMKLTGGSLQRTGSEYVLFSPTSGSLFTEAPGVIFCCRLFVNFLIWALLECRRWRGESVLTVLKSHFSISAGSSVSYKCLISPATNTCRCVMKCQTIELLIRYNTVRNHLIAT